MVKGSTSLSRMSFLKLNSLAFSLKWWHLFFLVIGFSKWNFMSLNRLYMDTKFNDYQFVRKNRDFESSNLLHIYMYVQCTIYNLTGKKMELHVHIFDLSTQKENAYSTNISLWVAFVSWCQVLAKDEWIYNSGWFSSKTQSLCFQKYLELSKPHQI